MTQREAELGEERLLREGLAGEAMGRVGQKQLGEGASTGFHMCKKCMPSTVNAASLM